MKQSKMVVDTTGSVKAQEILRQTVSNPSGFIAIEATNFIVKYIQVHQTTRFRATAMAKGRKVLQTIIAKLYRAKGAATELVRHFCVRPGREPVSHENQDQFPGADKHRHPLVGNVTIAMVAMEVEGDVDTVTNEMTNTKCSLATDDAQRQVFKDLQDEMEYTFKPHKHIWAVMYPTRKRHPGIIQVPEKRDCLLNSAVDNVYRSRPFLRSHYFRLPPSGGISETR